MTKPSVAAKLADGYNRGHPQARKPLINALPQGAPEHRHPAVGRKETIFTIAKGGGRFVKKSDGKVC